MNSRNTFLASLLSGTILGSAIAGPAKDSPPSQVISLTTLNLNSPAGVATLYRRIQRAADQVCQFPPDLRQLRAVRKSKACRAEALDRAVMQVGIPALHSLHLASTVRDSAPEHLVRNK